MNYLIGKQKIYESAFYPYGDGIITLPRRIRAYIDSSSDEFSHLTIENKLCDLGFAVTRGINLYTEIYKNGVALFGYLCKRSKVSCDEARSPMENINGRRSMELFI